MSLYEKAISKEAVLELHFDSDPSNPRKDEKDNKAEGWIGTMVCWHSRYTLGDEHNHEDTRDLFRSLVEEYSQAEFTIRYIGKAMRSEFRGIQPAKENGRWILANKEGIALNGHTFTTRDLAREALAIEKAEWTERAIDEELKTSQLLEIIQYYYVIKPLFLYDHSGISISTGSFVGRAHHAEWDSAQVGWIYAEKTDLMNKTAYSKGELFGKKSRRADTILRGEVEVYDTYLRGEILSYSLYEVDTEALEAYLLEENIELKELPYEDLQVLMTETDSCTGFFGVDAKTNGIADHIPKQYQHLLDLLQLA
ncbi:hypothetical protein [Paenibacillus xylanexedens]|uniref:hypothetical protein n=1 Tax=Paenibacillus xylanexedens TaxID=528191 RepID=UPI00119F4F97|nr:hypothetical protein [Paenibacillus xylanexedens]